MSETSVRPEVGLASLRTAIARIPRTASAEGFDEALRRCLAGRWPLCQLAIAPVSDDVVGLVPSLEPSSAPLILRDGGPSQVITLPLALGGVVLAVLEVVMETAAPEPVLELRGLGEPLAALVLARPGAVQLAPANLLLECASHTRAVHGNTGCGRTHDAFHLITRFPDGRTAEELLHSLADPHLVTPVELWVLEASLTRAVEQGLTRLAVRPTLATLRTHRLRELLTAAPLPIVLELADTQHVAAFHEMGVTVDERIEVVAVLDPRIPLRAA